MQDAAYPRLRTALAPYAGLSHAAAAAALNAATVTVQRAIPAREIKKLWGRWGVLGTAWVMAQDATLPAPVRAICRATYDNLMGDLFADLNPHDPEAAADINRYLNVLEAAGVLTAEQRAATLALGEAQVSPGSLVGWPVVTAADVAAAREMTDAGE